MKITNKYVFFWGGEWSNWYKSSFVIDGITFNCVEQWMMYMKAKTFGDEESATLIMKTKNPREQKRLGRFVKNYDNTVWDKIRLDIVQQGVYCKIKQNPELEKLMREQGDRIFVEASPLDTIWGIGMAEDDPNIEDEKNWKGLNLLGVALTNVAKGLK
jgi:ribA/ribD-fused uncharacterized protein